MALGWRKTGVSLATPNTVVSVIRELLRKRRFCQYGHQPEVNGAVIEGDWWRQPFLFGISNGSQLTFTFVISNANGCRHHLPFITAPFTAYGKKRATCSRLMRTILKNVLRQHCHRLGKNRCVKMYNFIGVRILEFFSDVHVMLTPWHLVGRLRRTTSFASVHVLPFFATFSLSDRGDYLLYVLTLCLIARMYNLTKFARLHRTQSGNMCKLDHRALSHVKVLSETHLFAN